MANIRWCDSGSITITSNDSVMEEVELGRVNRNLSRLALNSNYGVNPTDYYFMGGRGNGKTFGALKRALEILHQPSSITFTSKDELKGHKPIIDDYFIETPIVKMIRKEVMKNMPKFDVGDRVVVSVCIDKRYTGKSGEILDWYSKEPGGEYYYNVMFDDRTIGKVSFEESMLRKELPNERRFDMKNIPKWNLGDKVIYIGNNDIAHNRHGVITGLTMDLNTNTPRYKFSWLESGCSGDYWRTYEVFYCKDTDFIPYVPYTDYTGRHMDYTGRYIASDVRTTYEVLKEKILSPLPPYQPSPEIMIEKAIFNPPYTIVIFSDKSKSIVKCGEGDTYDPEKGLALAICKKGLGTNKSGSNYYDIFKKFLPKENVSEPKPVKEEPKKDNNPCNGCPDRRKGCLTNCEKMQEFVNDIQDTEASPKPIEPGYFIKHAEERKNKPKAHATSPFKDGITVLNINFDPKPITHFVEKFDAALFPSNFLAFCKKNNLYFFVVDKLKGGMNAIDPYTTNWQQVTRYLKSGVMESCMKMKDHNINNSFLAVDMDKALFAKLPVELRGENRKEKDLYDESGKA